jgi:hypothetical protein
MPLSFSAEEMDLLTALALPIDQKQRGAFIMAVAQEIEASGRVGGPGLVHQVGARIQRQFWDPPQISPNATAPVHRGSAG